MKIKIFLAFVCLVAFVACSDDDDEILVKYKKYQIQNLTSSDVTIHSSFPYADSASVFIAKGELGAVQTLTVSAMYSYDNLDDEGNGVALNNMSVNYIEIGDSLLVIPYENGYMNMRLCDALKSADDLCYMAETIGDTYVQTYVLTDETINRLIYYYSDEMGLDIVKHSK